MRKTLLLFMGVAGGIFIGFEIAYAGPGDFFFESDSPCRGIMIVTIGSLFMNLFLMFRLIHLVRSSRQAAAIRSSKAKEKNVLQHINELRYELEAEKRLFTEREKQLRCEITEWKSKYKKAVKGRMDKD